MAEAAVEQARAASITAHEGTTARSTNWSDRASNSTPLSVGFRWRGLGTTCRHPEQLDRRGQTIQLADIAASFSEKLKAVSPSLSMQHDEEHARNVYPATLSCGCCSRRKRPGATTSSRSPTVNPGDEGCILDRRDLSFDILASRKVDDDEIGTPYATRQFAAPVAPTPSTLKSWLNAVQRSCDGRMCTGCESICRSRGKEC